MDSKTVQLNYLLVIAYLHYFHLHHVAFLFNFYIKQCTSINHYYSDRSNVIFAHNYSVNAHHQLHAVARDTACFTRRKIYNKLTMHFIGTLTSRDKQEHVHYASKLGFLELTPGQWWSYRRERCLFVGCFTGINI